MNIKVFTVSVIALAAVASVTDTQAATVTGSADATVIQPIAITAVNPLAFGKFVKGATGGTVVLTTAGGRTATGAVVLSTAGAFESAGTFTVTGETDATFTISVPANVTLTEAGTSTTMVITTFSDLNGTTATTTAAGNVTGGTLTGGTQTLYVGGELAVGAAQVPANYTGTYAVTVEYN